MSRRKLSPVAKVGAFLLVSLTIPTLFVLLVSPTVMDASAQELGPKQAFIPASRALEAPNRLEASPRRPSDARSRSGNAAKPPAKPSGKMGFVPDSPAPRTNSTAAPRSSSNAVVRRPVPPQPQKFAASNPSRVKSPQPSVSRPETPAVVARQRPAPVEQKLERSRAEQIEPPAQPNVVAAKLPDAPAEFSELPEPFFEQPIVSTPQPPARTLDDDQEQLPIRTLNKQKPSPALTLDEETKPSLHALDNDQRQRTIRTLDEEKPSPSLTHDEEMPLPVRTLDEESPPTRPSRNVVQRDFEDESPDNETEESMEFFEPPTSKPIVEHPEPSVRQSRPFVIHDVATPSDLDKVVHADHQVDPEASEADDTEEPIKKVMAELKPVRTIELRKAVEVPPLAEMDNPQLHQPTDQALTILRGRRPLHFWPIYRDPWMANRDSYPFHHKPLWFEDPNLERCGSGWGHATTTVSAIRFASNIAILPYRITAEPPCRCVRTLPDCTVCEKFGYDAYLPPWSWSAAAVQAAATVGCIYVIP